MSANININEGDLKDTVQDAIKKTMIDTKYNDESISFGQAVVTHHYFQMQQQLMRNGQAQPTGQNRAITPSQMMESAQNIMDDTQGQEGDLTNSPPGAPGQIHTLAETQNPN